MFELECQEMLDFLHGQPRGEFETSYIQIGIPSWMLETNKLDILKLLHMVAHNGCDPMFHYMHWWDHGQQWLGGQAQTSRNE